jgi:hypothetical protein
VLGSSLEDYESILEKGRKEVLKQEQKFERSSKRYKDVSTKTNINLNTNIGLEIELHKEMLKNQFLRRAVTILCNEIPEMKSALTNNLQEVGIQIASRPLSVIASSEASVKSMK